MNDWVPLLQSLAWIGLILYLVHSFTSQLQQLFDAIRQRIRAGSSFRAGPVELGADLKNLERVSPSGPDSNPPEDDWSKERDEIYRNNCGLFLAHIIEPSDEEGQEYDIFIYLIRHKSQHFDDIEKAEFFLGKYWDNKIFTETPKDGLLGVATSAYGPFLCTCRVTMRDGSTVRLSRYIDFEMGRVFEGRS